MRVDELASQRVAIWGLGREGGAALQFIRRRHPQLPLVLLDDAADALCPEAPLVTCAFGREKIAAALAAIDVVVKSPGVSLYDPLVQKARDQGVAVTSLTNLWLAEPGERRTIAVTGSKGKSTTATIIAHMLRALGVRVDLVGNVGIPVTEADRRGDGYIVMEVSSYQAADFAASCDIAVLTSLHPEHLDWHRSLEQYYRDKANLLRHAKIGIVNATTAAELSRILGADAEKFTRFNTQDGLHFIGDAIWKGSREIGAIPNAYLAREHNKVNLCGALTVIDALALDLGRALASVADFRGLPHRQQLLGTIDGRDFVDDSISTTSDSALAALAAYAGRPITIILGGFDRQIDYGPLVGKLLAGAARAVICLGTSGARIHEALLEGAKHGRASVADLYKAADMSDAVEHAKRVTPPGGVVLLSPAAPSYGVYKSFIERGRDFAAKAGLANPFYQS